MWVYGYIYAFVGEYLCTIKCMCMYNIFNNVTIIQYSYQMSFY